MKKIPIFTFFKKYKKRFFIFIPLVLLCTLFFLPKPPPSLDVQTVKRNNIIETLSTNGTVVPETEVDLTFPISGKLVYLNAKKGDEVKQGQVIATLDQQTVQKNLESSLRDYAKQRNTFDQTQYNYNAKSPTDAVNDSIKRILENNQYDLDKAVISVELQDLAKQQSVLTTPIDGIVTRADVTTTGVNIGVGTIFSVVDPKDIIFRVEVDEADIGKIEKGQEMNVSLDAYPDDQLHLTVDDIDFQTHKTDTGGDAFYVQAKLPENDAMQYRSGMNGTGDIKLKEVDHVLTVPFASTIDDHYVYVKTSQGFEKRNITLGIADDTDVEVKSGLHEGDIVALDPTAAAEQVKPAKRFSIF